MQGEMEAKAQRPEVDYKAAGVDIEAGNQAVAMIKRDVESTFSDNVLTGLGSFASIYDLKDIINNYQHPVLVQSIDGVGTKMMVARRMQKFDTIGIDLLSAAANDIVVIGAKPITMLDYIANDRLDPRAVAEIVSGLALACRETSVSLVGGETAEMPGTYQAGEYDLVGVVTGILEKENAILGKAIKPGDVVLAFPSSGLHTNGYSLARKLVFEVAAYDVDTRIEQLGETIGEALLRPHLNYTNPVRHLLDQQIAIKGMAHITGGGVLENLPRVLPEGCAAEIKTDKLSRPPVFDLLADISAASQQELYRTFNMGMGMLLVLAPEEAVKAQALMSTSEIYPLHTVGEITHGEKTVRLVT